MHTKCRNCTVANRVSGCVTCGREIMRVMRELDVLTRDSAPAQDPIEEQLRQCPDAFKVGELIEKMVDAAHSTREEKADLERLLPPAGAVIPPLV